MPNKLARSYINRALDIMPADLDYYSVGLTTGSKNLLVAGKTRDPNFEVAYAASYNPKD